MTRNPSTLKGLVAVIGMLAAHPLLGQTTSRLGENTGSEMRLLSIPAGGDGLTSRIPWAVQETVGRKSPLLAGALSFFILPGVGSYYAGNNSHGTRHMLIAGGSFALMLAGWTLWTEEVVDDCIFGHGECDTSNAGPLLAVGAGVYLVNALWAVGTAMGDANAYNQAIASGGGSAQLMGGISVQPTLRLSSPVGLTAVGTMQREPRLGLRFVRAF